LTRRKQSLITNSAAEELRAAERCVVDAKTAVSRARQKRRKLGAELLLTEVVDDED
jgi:hypothetical protein